MSLMKKAQCTMCNLYIKSLGAPTFIVWFMISNIIKFLCVKKKFKEKVWLSICYQQCALVFNKRKLYTS